MADEHELTWRLADPGMDLLERAGLAALYMVLRASSDAGKKLSPLKWTDADLQSDSVTVRWTGSPKPAFEKLMEWAWQVTGRDGVLFLPAVHDERDRANLQHRVPSHNGIMRTFLQHTNVQPKGEPVTKIIKLGEEKEIAVSYQPPIIRPSKAKEDDSSGKESGSKKLLKPWKDISDLFDRKEAFRKEPIGLSNWVFPGIAGRYSGEGAWEGMPERAVLLMLAPTVCLYQRLQGAGGNWVIVIPDVRDLEEFDVTRRRMVLNADFVDVASLGDAGLQFVAEYSTRNPRKQLGSGCRVVAMGKVGYYASQSIRKSVLSVAAESIPVDRYRLLHQALPNLYIALRREDADGEQPAKDSKPTKRSKPVKTKPTVEAPKAAGFMKLPAARGRIADNLVGCRPWYENLFVPQTWDQDAMEKQRKRQPGTSIERLWFQAICYQRSKLMRLIQEDDMWDSEAEKVFVEAFWQTISSLKAQEADAVKRGGSATVEERWERLDGKLYRSLVQAKTRHLLRAALTSWFAKAGRQRTIGAHCPAIWRLIDHPDHWHKGRDLALLALASHRSKEDRDSSSPNSNQKGS
jgi:CRISPR-associated protein Cas8a1/Csx13